MRQLSPEGVLGLGPSLVLAAEGSGPKEAMAVLDAASIPVVHVPDRFTGEGIVEKIRLIAQATGAVTRGECLAKLVEGDLAALAALRGAHRAPAQDAVHPLVHERAADGVGARDRGRRDHQACRRRQRRHRIRRLQADQRRGGHRRAPRRRAGHGTPFVPAGCPDRVRASRLRQHARRRAKGASSRWMASIFSASDRAPRAPPAISPSRSIRRLLAS